MLPVVANGSADVMWKSTSSVSSTVPVTCSTVVMVLLADNGSASHKDTIRVNRDNFFISKVLLLGFKINSQLG